MNRARIVLWCLASVGLVGAHGCGQSEHPPVAEDETPGNVTARPPKPGELIRDDDDASATDVAAATGDAALNGGGPRYADGGGPSLPSGDLQVEMLKPSNEDQPDDVYNESLTVKCRIASGSAVGDASAAELDPATVFFELLSTDGEVLDTQAGASGDEPDLFEAKFPTQNLDSGRLRARCRASDDSAQAHEVAADATTFIDHGPLVAIISPLPNAPESVLGAVSFEYQVAPDELQKKDTAAAVETVTLSLFGKSFELEEQEDEPGVYKTTVDFQNPKLFKEPPTGSVQVAVEATNARGITQTTNYEFVLDGAGPAVTIISPLTTAIIGGKVELSVIATDDITAIDWDTLIISLNDEPYPYDKDGPWAINGETVTFTFETGEISGSIEQITVNVLVNDLAGNVSPGAAGLYYRDELPPLVSMNPPNFRVADMIADPHLCSVPFDPLGPAAPQDGDDVKDLAQYRALVWDETNHATGGDVLHPAYVNRESVYLFVRKPDAPLVIDTDGDDQCDDIAEEDTRFQQLTALEPRGLGSYSTMSDATDPPSIVTTTVVSCVLTDLPPPPQLCAEAHSDMTIVVAHAVGQSEPLVYAVKPDDSLECTGRRWELPSAGLSGYQGWVCLAVRAIDNVGNRGISAPIAVCLDNGQVEGTPDCYDNDIDKPDCTDGCKPPETIEPQIVRQ